MSECTHNCSTCGESCGERTSPQSLKSPTPMRTSARCSASCPARAASASQWSRASFARPALRCRSIRVGILDADITGPSIPKAFGMHEKAVGTENALLPCVSSTGIEVMSINLLLDDETDPVIWRGPVIGGVVTQFWTDRSLGCRLPPSICRRAPAT